jgi:hypothetical protein
MIEEYIFPSAIDANAGDVFEILSGMLTQKRDGLIIKSWDLKTLRRQQVETVKIVGNKITSLILERSMPGQNVSMTKVRENQQTGTIYIDFSSGSQHEFESWEAVGEIANSIDSTPDLAEKILLGKAFRASPDGTNKTTQVDASVSTNLLAAEPIVYTPAK